MKRNNLCEIFIRLYNILVTFFCQLPVQVHLYVNYYYYFPEKFTLECILWSYVGVGHVTERKNLLYFIFRSSRRRCLFV